MCILDESTLIIYKVQMLYWDQSKHCILMRSVIQNIIWRNKIVIFSTLPLKLTLKNFHRCLFHSYHLDQLSPSEK